MYNKDLSKRYAYASEVIRDLNRFIPWQDQVHKKEILSDFIQRFKVKERTTTKTNLRTESIYQEPPWLSWISVSLVLLLFLFGGFQINRFLQNERLASVRLKIDHPPATVSLDGKKIKDTENGQVDLPFLSPGNHVIMVQGHDNFGTAQFLLELIPGQKKELGVELPKRIPFSQINIQSVPAGAQLILDGTLIGTTPINGMSVESGKHIIKIMLNGYDEFESERYFKNGENYSLNFLLHRKKTSFK